MSFVLPVRKGGLGNQMFQVAAALIYAKETNRTVLLPREFYNSHNSTKGDYADSIFRECIHRIEKPMDGFAIQLLLQNGFVQHPGEPGFEDWTPLDMSGNILLHGYFQNAPPIQRHEDLLRIVYLNGLANYRMFFHDSKQRMGLHVRRGDYLNPPHSDVLPTQGLDYYEAALRHFDVSNMEVHIFSDDIDWCKQQSLFQDLPKKVFIDEPHEVKCLAIMTTCQGGFICANSTFSWWGAFLGAHSHRNPVVVPQNWFKGGVGKLFPNEWIQI